MSLLRVAAARLPSSLRCLQTASTSCQGKITHQSNFEGVFGAYFWDHDSGFGYTNTGELVLVSPDDKRSGTSIDSIPESQVWFDIIEPKSLISHDNLKDELQMNVLAYADLVHHCEDSTAMAEVQVPIYKLSVSDIISNSSEPGPFSSGGQKMDDSESPNAIVKHTS